MEGVDLTTHHAVVSRHRFRAGRWVGGIWTTPTYDATTNTVFVSTGTLNPPQTLSQASWPGCGHHLGGRDHWQLPFYATVTDSDWGRHQR